MATPEWTIGIYTGASPLALSNPENVRNPVIKASDVNDFEVNIVAHPFMLITENSHYLFFTAKNNLRGEHSGIGCAVSRDGLHWRYRRLVLREPFVLAHPQVFAWQGNYYMVPEAHEKTVVRLYRAIEFPDRWAHQQDLLTGDKFISPTLFRHGDMWWMYVSAQENAGLRLFYAKELTGPWVEHPRSPIISGDLHSARPAGTPFVVDGALYRLGQDCYPTYGLRVFAYRVTQLSTTQYSEEKVDQQVVGASSQGWNSDCMHHVDAHQARTGGWIAAVDACGVVEG
jgi:hypothetical protein